MKPIQDKKHLHLYCLFLFIGINIAYSFCEGLSEQAKALLGLVLALGMGSCGVILFSDWDSKDLQAGKTTAPNSKACRRDSFFLAVICVASGPAMAFVFVGLAGPFLFNGHWVKLNPLFGPDDVLADIKKYGYWSILALAPMPLLEEFIFRKNLLSLLRKNSVPGASFIVSVLFAASHNKDELAAFLWVFLTSFVYNWLFLRTGRLRETTLLHYAYDLSLPALPENFAPKDFGGPGLWGAFLGLGILGLLFLQLRAYSRKHFKASKPVAAPQNFKTAAYAGALGLVLLRVLTYRLF